LPLAVICSRTYRRPGPGPQRPPPCSKRPAAHHQHPRPDHPGWRPAGWWSFSTPCGSVCWSCR